MDDPLKLDDRHRPESRLDVVNLLARGTHHYVVTFTSGWHSSNGNSPAMVRVYKESLRELAGKAVSSGYEVWVEEPKPGHMYWFCKEKKR